MGDVTRKRPLIEKSASEVSFVWVSSASDTRTLTWPPIASGMFHEKLPAAAPVEATMVPGQVLPLSVEYSSLTFANEPLGVHVTFWDIPTYHVSVPFGMFSVTLPLISKFCWDSSSTFVGSATNSILTRTWVPMLSGIPQEYDRSEAGTVAMALNAGNVPPPSVE